MSCFLFCFISLLISGSTTLPYTRALLLFCLKYWVLYSVQCAWRDIYLCYLFTRWRSMLAKIKPSRWSTQWPMFAGIAAPGQLNAWQAGRTAGGCFALSVGLTMCPPWSPLPVTANWSLGMRTGKLPWLFRRCRERGRSGGDATVDARNRQ